MAKDKHAFQRCNSKENCTALRVKNSSICGCCFLVSFYSLSACTLRGMGHDLFFKYEYIYLIYIYIYISLSEQKHGSFPGQISYFM